MRPPDPAHDVFVRRGPPAWPTGFIEVWFVWCAGEHVAATTLGRDVAVAKARAEAALRGVSAWLGEPGSEAIPI